MISINKEYIRTYDKRLNLNLFDSICTVPCHISAQVSLTLGFHMVVSQRKFSNFKLKETLIQVKSLARLIYRILDVNLSYYFHRRCSLIIVFTMKII